MPRNKATIEYTTITSDGFRYRGRIHANTNNLLKWFKEHFRDPVPGVGKQFFVTTQQFLFIENLVRFFSTHNGPTVTANLPGGCLRKRRDGIFAPISLSC